MNKANFLTHERFPADSETWDFLQELTKMAVQLTAVGGRNYILSGCETAGNLVTKGYIVIEGELLPFENGTLATHVVISGDKKSVTYEGVDYTNLYEYRVARFGSGSPQYPWSSFKRISDLLTLEKTLDTVKTDLEESVKDLETAIDTDLNERMPKGAIVMWAGATVPKGWTVCNGSNGTPDLRGRFVVGVNTDSVNTFKYGLGTRGGAEEIKLTIAQMPSHEHKRSLGRDDRGTKGSPGVWSDFNDDRKDTSLGSAGGDQPHENRPPFYALYYIQKL